MFCVECGKKTDKLYDGLCIDCYLKKHKFFNIPEEVVIKVCRNCGAYKIGDEWKHGDIKKLIKEQISLLMNNNCKLDINYDDKKIICTGNFEGHEIKEEGQFKIKFKKVLCEKCSLKKGGYFEAILQVRKKNMDKKEKMEIEKIVNKKIDEMKSFILKKEERKGAIDCYIGSKKAAAAAAREIKDLFKGKEIMTSSLVGMKKGVEVYRDTYSVRLPEYKIGSFIKLDEKVYRIVSIGRKIEIASLEGEKRQIYKDEIEKARMMEMKSRDAVVLHEDKNGLYVMDEMNYKTYWLKKPEGWERKSKIKIVEFEGKIYMIE